MHRHESCQGNVRSKPTDDQFEITAARALRSDDYIHSDLRAAAAA